MKKEKSGCRIGNTVVRENQYSKTQRPELYATVRGATSPYDPISHVGEYQYIERVDVARERLDIQGTGLQSVGQGGVDGYNGQ